MDAIWRGENILRKSLARWNSSNGSLIAQKLVQVITVCIVLVRILAASIQRSSGVLMTGN
ncbi:hypothetical protein BDR07DRAFT_1401562 [Suillus spraguei]|nr:hypothetical protein BDR07DRAFT_1401562 [Suillus spraguei]